MKIRNINLILIALSLTMISCEKVIDIDLDPGEKKYVIEANLGNQSGSCSVLISQTKAFDEGNAFKGTPGAIVRISENGGPAVVLTETAPGVHEATALVGQIGKQYELTVSVGGKTFNAVAVMQPQVNLEGIFTTTENLFTENRLIVNAVFNDPAGKGNHYRFIQYFNGIKQEDLQFMNDDYTDGRNVTAKLFYFDDDDDENELKSGDEVRVEMYCIDEAMYKYWYSLLRSSSGDSNQATPSNPVSNIQGGALGYFSVHTKETKTMIVP